MPSKTWHGVTSPSIEGLRSERWFGANDLRSFGHRSRAKQVGRRPKIVGRPIIAILNTWSDPGTCHSHFRERGEESSAASSKPADFRLRLPALSISETYMKPTSMIYRNLWRWKLRNAAEPNQSTA